MAKDIWERVPARMLSTEGRDWLGELREEWNVLQDKAEKWDELEPYLLNMVGHPLIEWLKKFLDSIDFDKEEAQK